eukprot:scaffold672665_cov33-Prasinocladus_malaysianus.AAC.2
MSRKRKRANAHQDGGQAWNPVRWTVKAYLDTKLLHQGRPAWFLKSAWQPRKQATLKQVCTNSLGADGLRFRDDLSGHYLTKSEAEADIPTFTDWIHNGLKHQRKPSSQVRLIK